MFDSKPFLASLTHLPGVYRMIDAAGEVIYVGKARDLKKRISSYFQKTDHIPRTRLMVSLIASVAITVTRSEAEALLLENNLIKSLSPRFNILFRDDKSYPYILLTGSRFPRLAYYRGVQNKGNQYFGPFPNAGAVRESIQLLQKVFCLRTCEDSVFNNRSRPCLLHQIQRCSAPCVGQIAADQYQADVHSAALFLQGRDQQLIDDLSQQMQACAERFEYEAAAIFRDRIGALRRVQEKQYVSGGSKADADILACYQQQGVACVNLVMMRGGRHLGDKSFFPTHAEKWDTASVLEAFLGQHYVNQAIPGQILVNEGFDASEIEALLSAQAQHKVNIIHRCIGDRRVWVEMALTNAKLAVEQRLNQKSSQEARLAALQLALNLPDGLQRIECFDISHTMGESTVASCVVFDQGDMRNAEYRRYNISGITPGDDYAAMRDALQRRYEKIAEGEGRMPDLVLIDGGKGQLGVAIEVLNDLGLSSIPLVGVAKGEARKPGLEQLIIPNADNAIQLPADHPALHLIQQIRDEAHRFAISGHRARRGKARTQSTLEDISGIGAKRRQRLLARFGGLKGVKEANIDELAQVEGISRALAEKIYQELH